MITIITMPLGFRLVITNTNHDYTFGWDNNLEYIWMSIILGCSFICVSLCSQGFQVSLYNLNNFLVASSIWPISLFLMYSYQFPLDTMLDGFLLWSIKFWNTYPMGEEISRSHESLCSSQSHRVRMTPQIPPAYFLFHEPNYIIDWG